MMIVNRAVVLSLLVSAGTAFAQPGDTVGAEALFREGKRLMKEGKLAEACDKLAASEHLDRSIGTLLNLADCREKNHQLATAWATFLEGASLARSTGDTARESEARKRASVLEAHLSYLTISVPDASKVEGLVIKRGDLSVDPALWNQGVPIDTGAYEISGQAPGHEPWSTRVQISSEGQHASVEVPRFKQLADMTKAVAKIDPPKEPPAETNDDDASDAPPAEHHTFTTLRYASVTSAAVGVIALTGGIVVGLKARDLQHQSDAICPDATCSDPHGLDLNNRARSDLMTSEILVGVGGAAVVAATVMWFVGAPAERSSERVSVIPSVTASHAGLAVVGRF